VQTLRSVDGRVPPAQLSQASPSEAWVAPQPLHHRLWFSYAQYVPGKRVHDVRRSRLQSASASATDPGTSLNATASSFAKLVLKTSSCSTLPAKYASSLPCAAALCANVQLLRLVLPPSE
jgi:hypothetical protein